MVCLGEVLIQMNQLDEEDSRLFYSVFGGDVPNFAIAIGRQGSSVKLLSLVGNDLLGGHLIELWQKERVNHSHVTCKSNYKTKLLTEFQEQ